MDGTVSRVIVGRVVPFLHDLPPFVGIEQRNGRNRAIGVGSQPCDERLVVPQQPGYRRVVEKVGIVFGCRDQFAAVVSHGKRQVEHGRAPVHRHRLQAQPRQMKRSRGRLIGEHDLEERRAARVAAWLQRLDQVLERQVLMREGPERVCRAPGRAVRGTSGRR